MSQPGGTPSRSNGQWKSVKTLEQFWETMAFRQECSSGRIVGFIWVVITPVQPSIPEEDEGTEPSQSQTVNESFITDSFNSIPPVSSPRKEKSSPRKPRRRKVKTSSGPIPLILPKIKSSSSNLSTMSSGSSSSASKLPENSPYYKWPSSSRGTLLLSAQAYNRAHEIIIHQNFATRNSAAKSTKRWVQEVAVLGGMDNWGWTVVGKKEASTTSNGTTVTATPVTVMGVRKKRKPDTVADSQTTEKCENGVHVLSEGLVRKKVKTEEGPTAGTTTAGASAVNTLRAGLVRRKPKN